MAFLGLLLGAAALLEPAPVENDNWHALSFGANAGAVHTLFVERRTIINDDIFKYAWIYETFDASLSPFADKKERVEFDCRRRRYRGVVWYWTDLAGHYLTADKEDLRFSEITPDSPMEAALDFVCRFTSAKP